MQHQEVSTGSYWHIMKWREPGSTAFSEFSGWILVKNRDSIFLIHKQKRSSLSKLFAV